LNKVAFYVSVKTWLVVVVILFALGIVWGLSTPAGTSGAFSGETNALQQLADFISGLPLWLMFGFILLKNVSAVLLSFILSPFFLIMPIMSLVINGWLVGAVANTVVAQHSVGYLLIGILPHGVFELPALFIGEAAAISFGVAAMRGVFDKSGRGQLTATLRTDLKYLAISLLLFLPAALMETFVTPMLLKRFG
jgi:stage II sporulation protein M